MVRTIRISEKDNVAIVVHQAEIGDELDFGVKAASCIPEGHKTPLCPIDKGMDIIRYGAVLGKAARDMKPGDWVSEDDIIPASSPALDTLRPEGKGKVIKSDKLEGRTWLGYTVEGSEYAGTRNILAITTTVQCVAGVVKNAVERIRTELLPKFPNVDDVVAITHAYGCGVAINAPDAVIPIRCIRNIMRNPNFGNVYMVVGLGCEKLSVDKLLSEEENTPENVIMLQDCSGSDEMIDSMMRMAEKKLAILNKRTRTEQPISKLILGVQCGGSDAFSGITSNPTIGMAGDKLAAEGATVMFSEVTEVRDAVHEIASRANDEAIVRKLVKEIKWYDDYLDKGGVDRSANPTPGNKKGGLCNIIEKSMGSIAKSGESPIAEVIGPGELPTKHGMLFAATPASDFVCAPTQIASGITLQVFSTGRGTPYGLREIPVIKICSRDTIAQRWPDIFDINAGLIAEGKADKHAMSDMLVDLILDVASGKKQSKAQQHRIYNDLVIDNPAPIT
ncbi:MAG: UxaA family hydrolase [Candidatus Ornithospirochaeta sp.]|nr:UxaA family hydrolase [Candidatus Ornithospirochaeta sp.]